MQTYTHQFDFRAPKGSKHRRPSLSVQFDGPSKDDVIAYLSGMDDSTKKVRELIMDKVTGVIVAYIKEYVDEDLKFNQEMLQELIDEGKISLEYIANLPPSERAAMPKDALVDFANDYLLVMPEITGKDAKRVAAAATLITERFRRAAGDDEVLQFMLSQITTFAEKAPADLVEQHELAITWCVDKLKALLALKIDKSML